MGSEIGPLSSPGMTSYRSPDPILTIGLSHSFRSAPDVPSDGQTDGRTDGISLATGGTVH